MLLYRIYFLAEISFDSNTYNFHQQLPVTWVQLGCHPQYGIYMYVCWKISYDIHSTDVACHIVIRVIRFHLEHLRHAYAWQIGPFWRDTLDLWLCIESDWVIDITISNISLLMLDVLCDLWLLTLGLFGRRVIVVTCVCPSVRLSVCLSVCSHHPC